MDCSTPGSCYLPSPGVSSNSCPLNRWCHPTISSSVTPFSSCLQTFPASASFPMSWLLKSSRQTIGVSASASVLPMNIQDWFPLGLTRLMSLLSKALLRVFSSTTVQKHQFFDPTLTSILPMITGKIITLAIRPLSAKWCLCFLIWYLGLSHLFFQGASVL